MYGNQQKNSLAKRRDQYSKNPVAKVSSTVQSNHKPVTSVQPIVDQNNSSIEEKLLTIIDLLHHNNTLLTDSLNRIEKLESQQSPCAGQLTEFERLETPRPVSAKSVTFTDSSSSVSDETPVLSPKIMF